MAGPARQYFGSASTISTTAFETTFFTRLGPAVSGVNISATLRYIASWESDGLGAGPQWQTPLLLYRGLQN